MSSARPTPVELAFGVELEILTGSRSHPNLPRNIVVQGFNLGLVGAWELIADELSQKLSHIQVKNYVFHSYLPRRYREGGWKLSKEVKITPPQSQNTVGIKFDSPVFDFHTFTNWHWHMDAVWWVLRERLITSTNDECSTHVLISPSKSKWTLDQVKRVAKAVLYFERCVDALMPEPQRQSVWAQSNRYNISLKHHDINTLFNWIDVEHELNDISYITYLMCTCSMYSELGQTYGRTHDFSSNLFRWNFKGLTHIDDLPRTTGESKGAIEFRQPPGSVDAASTKLWVTFAASFIQGALVYGHTLDGTKTATLDDLRTFLINGAIQSGVQDHSMLNQLLDGKTGLPSGEFEVRQLTQYDLSRIHREYSGPCGSNMQLKFAQRLAPQDKRVGRLPPGPPPTPE